MIQIQLTFMSRSLKFLPLLCLLGILACSQPKPSDYTLHISIEDWTHKFKPQATKSYPIEVSNRMRWNFKGDVWVHILQKQDTLKEYKNPSSIPKGGVDTVWVDLLMPESEGVYEIVASVVAPDGHRVKSRRIIEVEKPFTLSE